MAVQSSPMPKDPTPHPATAPLAPGKAFSFAEFQADAPRVVRNPGAQPLLISAVPKALPHHRLLELGQRPGGDVFHLGESAVARLQLNLRQLRKGVELNLALTPAAARQFDQNTQSLPLEPFEVGGLPTRAHARRVDYPGSTAEFVPPGEPQAWAGRLRLRVFGATAAVRREFLASTLESLLARRLLEPADPFQGEVYRRLCLLRQVNPREAERLSRQLSSVGLGELDLALAHAGVDPLRIAGSRLDEVFEGHLAVVDPQLGAQYARLGVVAAVVPLATLEDAARALRDGALSRCEALTRGLSTAPGTPEWEVSGAAEYALARLLTADALKSAVALSGRANLISFGAPLAALLSRTDWHAWPKPCGGSTVSDTQLDPDAPQPRPARPGAFSARPVLGGLVRALRGDGFDPLTAREVEQFSADNEAWFQCGIAPSAFGAVAVGSEEDRAALQALTDPGQNIIVARRCHELRPALGLP